MDTLKADWKVMSDEHARLKVRKVALQRLGQMAILEAKAIRGDKPGAIHDFRVASRRLDQAFRLLTRDRMPASHRRLRRKLARGRKALSAVRNYDVFLRRTSKILARKRTSRREVWKAVHDYLQDERRSKHSKASGKLAKLNLSRTYFRMGSLLERSQPASRNRPGAAKKDEAFVDGSFADRLRSELAREWEGFEKAKNEAPDFSRTPPVHTLRLAGKRLRYLVEIIHLFESPLSGGALVTLRRLQRTLGDWHDIEIRERLLSKMAGRPEFLRSQLRLASEILKLIGECRKEKARIASRHPAVLDPAARERLKDCILGLLGGKGPDGRGAS